MTRREYPTRLSALLEKRRIRRPGFTHKGSNEHRRALPGSKKSKISYGFHQKVCHTTGIRIFFEPSIPFFMVPCQMCVMGKCYCPKINFLLRKVSIILLLMTKVFVTLFNPVGDEGSLNISSWNFATICRRAEYPQRWTSY